MAARNRRKQKSSDNEERSGARPFWSGTLTFGLVSVPVDLYPGNRTNRASLRMLGPEGEPLARRYFSQKTGRALDNEHMVRGYEFDKDKYVVITDEELERLAPDQSRDIDLRRFVELKSIPPLYFDRSYFLAPSAGSEKAYRLLSETMQKEKLAGIATFVMRGKEYLVAIFSDNGILRAETMRFADELRSPSDVGLPKKKDVPKATVTKFEKLIKNKSKKKFAPAKKLADKQTDSLLKLVKQKQKKRSNVVEVEAEAETDRKVIDLVQVLKKSLSGKSK